MSPQPTDDDLEMYNPPARRGFIGFLHLPYELRRMIYDYFIPRGYHVELAEGALRWAKNGQWTRIEHPFYNILRVSKQVSKECLDILYGDNMFVTQWEEGNDPFLKFLSEDNRNRIALERWYMVCDVENMPDCSWIYFCEIYIESRRGSLHVSMDVRDYNTDNNERVISFVFWDDEFIWRLGAILGMMVPQSTYTQVFLDTYPVFKDWMMDEVQEIFNVYLTEGYEVLVKV